MVTLRSPARPDARTGQALFPLIAVTALIYMAIVFLTVRPYGGNVSAMIGAWSPLVKAHRGVVGHRVVVFRDSGYDGFTYYVVAGNPFLGQSVYRDAFRSQRIGYPVAVAIASLGRLAWRPAAMVAVNLISVLAIAYLAGLILLDVGRDARVWLALVCAVNPSLIIGVQRDLAELLMTALALGGLLLFLRQRIGWASLALAVAMLTREVAILFIAPIVAAEVFARRPRRAVALALSVAPFVAWQLILSATLGQAGIASSEGQFVQPLMGMRAVIVAALHATGGHRAGWISVIAVILFVVAALVVSILTLRKRYDIFAAGMLVHAAAAIFAASSIWLGFASAARVFGGLYPLTTCAYARHRGRPLALLVGGIVALTAFTVIRFVFLMPHEAYYLTP